MPLLSGKSKAAFTHNIKAEVHAGKPIKQAVAIAYSKKREHMAEGGSMEDDDKMLMNHMAMEHMDAIHQKDVTKFHQSLRAIMGHMMNEMNEPENDSEPDED